MGSLHRLTAALLVLALLTPAGATCASATTPAGPMAGMSCCNKQAPATAGSMERDCCRMSEQLPEQAPATPAAPRTTVQAGTTSVLDAVPASIGTTDTCLRHELQSTRGRPLSPLFLRTSVLLI